MCYVTVTLLGLLSICPSLGLAFLDCQFRNRRKHFVCFKANLYTVSFDLGSRWKRERLRLSAISSHLIWRVLVDIKVEPFYRSVNISTSGRGIGMIFTS